MTKSVQNFLEDIRLLGEVQFDLVQAVRTLVESQFPDVEEVVKYGGMSFSSGV